MLRECCRAKTGRCASLVNPQPLGNFAKDRKRKDGLTPHCKACLKVFRDTNKEQRNETIKAWRAKNPEKMKEYRRQSAPQNRERARQWRIKNHLIRRYGITREQWQAMFDAQDGRCYLCGSRHEDLKQGLCIDHCHLFGHVRGLLCNPCNQGLGLLKDDPKLLRKAAEYIEMIQP